MLASLKQNKAVLFIIAVLVVTAYFVFTSGSQGATATLTTATGEHAIEVEIADTDASRETGLMNRSSMPANHGMLFDFKQTRPVAMWMKNTIIPLDMLFLDERGRIVNIATNAKPYSLDVIPSSGPVRYVLELNGGAAARYGAKAGDRLRHSVIP
ncbi:DUF192 domain-containing protein [Aureimonas sp. AU4]|uniref:DUF192 domain-containing protein n=1 Tax=Aureimonas sp. AU4 TaxID=1638163 RepID=UPI0007823D64|nr:DUF192 domain-containing protein [Aureimonas sp. AU4]